jgi:iron complex outermembrane receptor protein
LTSSSLSEAVWQIQFISTTGGIMRRFNQLQWNRGLHVAIALVLLVAAAAMAQTGSISGTVKAKGSGESLSGANVAIAGTTMGAASDANGNYTIAKVPPGNYTLRVSFIGYSEMTKEVTVTAGQAITANFELTEGGFVGDPIVVSASRRPEKLTEAPVTMSVINARGIDEFPAFNPGELAARQKGVDYVRAGVLGAGLNIRGFNSAFNSKNLQMNDMRLSTLIATSLPMGALSTTVKEDIERVELILGPAAVLYGPNAHNGLVNTLTKDPRAYPGTTVAIGGGNQSVASGRVRHAQVLSEKFAYKVAGEYSRGEEFAFTDTVYNGTGAVAFPQEVGIDRDFDSIRGETSLYYTLKPGTDLVFSGGASKSNNIGVTNAGRNLIVDWRIFYGQVRYVSPRVFAQVYHSWSKTEDTFAMNQRTQNYWSFKNAGFSEEEAFSRSLHQQWVGTSPTAGVAINREANFVDDSRRWNAEAQYNNTFGGFTVIAGAQFQRDLANSKHTYLLDQKGVIDLDQFGVYGQVEKPFGNSGFKLTLAGRADDHELYGSNFIPNGGLLYTNSAGTWRVTYGKGIASPSILNLSASIFGGLVLGNGEGFTLSDQTKIPKLEVETIQTIEAGYKGILAGRKLFLDVNAYYNFSENFLSPLLNIATQGRRVTHRGDTPMSEVVPGTPANGAALVLTYLNFGKVNTYGVDFGVNYYFNNNINVVLNYSFFDFTLDENDPKNDGDKNGKVEDIDLPINTPKNKASAGLNLSQAKYFGSIFARWVEAYDFFSGINVSAKTNTNLRVGTGAFADPVVENARVFRDFNEGPLGDFVNVDLSAGYRLNQNLSLAGHVTNVFDSDVREFVASPAIGRLFAAELKFNF